MIVGSYFVMGFLSYLISTLISKRFSNFFILFFTFFISIILSVSFFFFIADFLLPPPEGNEAIRIFGGGVTFAMFGSGLGLYDGKKRRLKRDSNTK
jgi:hypothetical protein